MRGRSPRRSPRVRVTPGDKNIVENICVTAIFCPTGNFSKFPKLCLSVCLCGVWCLIGTKAGIIGESREYVSPVLYSSFSPLTVVLVCRLPLCCLFHYIPGKREKCSDCVVQRGGTAGSSHDQQ